MVKNILSILLCFIAFNSKAQTGNYAIYNEAERQASLGNFQLAFQLLEDHKEADKCRVMGYYWLWVAIYTDMPESLTITFPNNNSHASKLVLHDAFTYSFKKDETPGPLLIKCPKNGNLHKVAGMMNWKKLEDLQKDDSYKSLTTEAGKYSDDELQKMLNRKKENHFDLCDKYAEKARFHFKKALEYGSYDSVTTFGLAQSLEYQAKYGEAIRYYSKAYNINSNYYLALLKTAACFGKISKWDSCSIYAEKVLFRSEDSMQLSAAHRLQAEAYWYGKKNKRNAQKSYHKAFDLVKDDYDNGLSYLEFLQDRGKTTKACRFASKFVGIHATNPHLKVGLEFLFKEKEIGEIVKKALKKASKGSNKALIISNRFSSYL